MDKNAKKGVFIQVFSYFCWKDCGFFYSLTLDPIFTQQTGKITKPNGK
jgi:hypothetical protein